MALVKMTIEQALASAQVNFEKLNATTEADMERHAAEDDAEWEQEMEARLTEERAKLSGS